MNQQAELKEPSAENPATIFLAPACNVDERCWCKDDQGPCDECGEPTVKYRRADLVDAEIARLRAEVERAAHLCAAYQFRAERLRAALLRARGAIDSHRDDCGSCRVLLPQIDDVLNDEQSAKFSIS